MRESQDDVDPMSWAVEGFGKARVLVVGDVMLDRYWSGPAERISPEAPVPIVNIGQGSDRAGGAGNVAVNLATLGAEVTLVGCVGLDGDGRTLTTMLEEAGVGCRLVAAEGARTTLKLRVLSGHHQMIRLDFEQAALPSQIRGLSTAFDEELARHDLVVFSDYRKGALAEVADLIARCRQTGKRAVVDPKGSDFGKYRCASVLAPNEREFAAAAGNAVSESDLEERASAMRARLELDAVVLTRGDRGMSVFTGDGPAVHIPSEAREVFDVTGAGDTVVATLAAALGVGHSLADAARLANRAAGLVVARLGTAAVTPKELMGAAERSSCGRILTLVELTNAVRAAQARGERVVMTNGCFDIVHAGHVTYLEQAAMLGQRLAVAINSDASVRRLKGDNRPVNAVRHRLAVVAALRCVDWVAEFDGVATKDGFDDTPRELITSVRPDVLVKGGDYRLEGIVGADTVFAYGGEVVAIPITEAVTTTGLVERIRGNAR